MILVKYMSSRMDKYENDTASEQVKTSRTARNKSIYSKVSDEDIDKLDVNNNISVIKTDAEDLDIDTIKSILNQQYEAENRRSNRSTDIKEDDDDSLEADEPKDEKEITKEYDLKKVLETAHKNKTPDYDRERFLKLRETQFDILNSLNIDRTDEPEPEETLSPEEANLMTLIKTVNFNAEQNKALKKAEHEDDLLSDLLGDEKTEVLEPVEIDMSVEPDKKPSLVEELEKTKQLSKKELDKGIEQYNELVDSKKKDETKNEEYETDTVELTPTEQMSNSFYTGKFHIDDKDMDDFADLENEMKGGIVVKILILILVLITLAVAVFLLNKYLNLGLF